MKLFGSALALFGIVLGTLAQVSGKCQEQCVYKEFGCKKLFSGQLDFEKRYSLKKGETCQLSNVKSTQMATCCTNEASYNDYSTTKQLREILGALGGAEEGEYPHQVQVRGLGACGGTVYNKEWVVTAAHCIVTDGKEVTNLQNGFVIAGKTDVSTATDEDKYKLKEIIVHEKWIHNKIALGHDIALLRLARPLPLEIGKIQPLRMEPADYKPTYGGKAIVMGFGTAGAHGTSDYLLEAEVPIHEPSKAARLSFDPLNGYGSGASPGHLAVAGDDSGFTVGKGDSGGPAICADENHKPLLCGIASFKRCQIGKVCRRPSYFLRVAPFIDWIREKTNNAEQEKEFLTDGPFLPVNIANEDAPGYYVRITGPKTGCGGALISPNKVITSRQCIFTNTDGDMTPQNVAVNTNIFHPRSGKDYLMLANLDNKEAQLDISKNITKFLHRPLGLNDMFLILLRTDVEKFQPLELPPAGYTIDQPAEEYTMNEKAVSLQKRTYLPMDRDRCEMKVNKIDSSLELHSSHLCMRQKYSAESECERDIGGPLVCEGKYLCGIKTFHGCGMSGFPEIYNNHLDPEIQGVIKQWNRVKTS